MCRILFSRQSRKVGRNSKVAWVGSVCCIYLLLDTYGSEVIIGQIHDFLRCSSTFNGRIWKSEHCISLFECFCCGICFFDIICMVIWTNSWGFESVGKSFYLRNYTHFGWKLEASFRHVKRNNIFRPVCFPSRIVPRLNVKNKVLATKDCSCSSERVVHN